MDVTRSLIPGTMPLWHRRALPADVLAPGGAGSASEQPVAGARTGSGGGAASAAAAPLVEIVGDPDGADVVLPTGVHIRRTRIGQYRVSDSELQQAILGVQLLPVQHQQLIARLGIPIQLVPVAHLEQVAGTIEPVVGATLVTGPVGNGRPVSIRIAARMADLHTTARVQEAVQHEIGHAVSVVSSQDRSEQTAIAYAARY